MYFGDLTDDFLRGGLVRHFDGVSCFPGGFFDLRGVFDGDFQGSTSEMGCGAESFSAL